ncbi:unnamed protein product [Cuscuta campestris]|uniref:Endonuclease/exonuclease/phosphatase domain-containing protein n=1 Tax=Cuscuta campestris TaxID=132261 RepID=A0A484L8A1_9ASTE|nr:unnamed protein product [Cuscuta campestris]
MVVTRVEVLIITAPRQASLVREDVVVDETKNQAWTISIVTSVVISPMSADQEWPVVSFASFDRSMSSHRKVSSLRRRPLQSDSSEMTPYEPDSIPPGNNSTEPNKPLTLLTSKPTATQTSQAQNHSPSIPEKSTPPLLPCAMPSDPPTTSNPSTITPVPTSNPSFTTTLEPLTLSPSPPKPSSEHSPLNTELEQSAFEIRFHQETFSNLFCLLVEGRDEHILKEMKSSEAPSAFDDLLIKKNPRQELFYYSDEETSFTPAHNKRENPRVRRVIAKNLPRLSFLLKDLNINFLAIIEPKSSLNNIATYHIKLGFDSSKSLCNNKVWTFWKSDFFTLAPTVPITSSPQIGTLYFSSSPLNSPCIISVVYGLHTKEERRELWTTISNLAESTHSPWIMGGDFNAISSINHHKGKSSPCLASISEFDHCINSNGLIDPPYSGSPYTWLGNRSLGKVWRRLDKIFYNSAIQDLNLHINSQHLPRGNSDHSPILLKLLSPIFNGPSPFKFLNCWSSHHTFHPLILQNWGPYEGGGMRGLSQKLNNIRSILQHWNKSTFGNIFKDREHHENLLAEAEIAFTSDPSEENDNLLQQARCELNKLVAREYSYWKQKANLKWVKEGDLNTKFFHAFVRHRRMQQSIGSIKGKDNSWLTTWQDISYEALHFFNSLFTEEPSHPHAEFIFNIPSLLTPADNNLLTSLPSLEEVKEAVWDLNPDSSPGPDGYSGHFLENAQRRNPAQWTWKIYGGKYLETLRN